MSLGGMNVRPLRLRRIAVQVLQLSGQTAHEGERVVVDAAEAEVAGLQAVRQRAQVVGGVRQLVEVGVELEEVDGVDVQLVQLWLVALVARRLVGQAHRHHPGAIRQHVQAEGVVSLLEGLQLCGRWPDFHVDVQITRARLQSESQVSFNLYPHSGD